MPRSLTDAVLPVVDLRLGSVVHGIAGQREQYQPIKSCLSPSARAAEIAGAIRAEFGNSDIYVADLDAIEGRGADVANCVGIASSGMRLWLDAGIGTPELALRHRQSISEAIVARYILGLESIPTPHELPQIASALPTRQITFSLDLQDGLLKASSAWSSLTVEAIVDLVVECGIASCIVLDLAAVGRGAGPVTTSLCAEIRRRHPDLELVSGGGIRTSADVRQLVEAGCDRVLVATAIHDGRISRRSLESA